MPRLSFVEARRRMVRSLRAEIKDERVLHALEQVPREEFVPDAQRERAYDDAALPIGQGQTISQPLIVALMTEALELRPGQRVLEVGAGSGYQAAVLAELGVNVDSVERQPLLVQEVDERLRRLGYRAVRVHPARADVIGWPEGAPYDAIVVTAAAPDVPLDLVRQLADGGRLVIPVGGRAEQQLLAIVRRGDGYSSTSLGACRFVPLIGPGAWPADSC